MKYGKQKECVNQNRIYWNIDFVFKFNKDNFGLGNNYKNIY